MRELCAAQDRLQEFVDQELQHLGRFEVVITWKGHGRQPGETDEDARAKAQELAQDWRFEIRQAEEQGA